MNLKFAVNLCEASIEISDDHGRDVGAREPFLATAHVRHEEIADRLKIDHFGSNTILRASFKNFIGYDGISGTVFQKKYNNFRVCFQKVVYSSKLIRKCKIG